MNDFGLLDVVCQLTHVGGHQLGVVVAQMDDSRVSRRQSSLTADRSLIEITFLTQRLSK